MSQLEDCAGAERLAWDAGQLIERCLGNAALARRLLARFESQLDEELGGLEAAYAAGDAERVARLAHRLKGAAGAVAVEGLRRAAAALETAARAGQLDAAAALLQELRDEQRRLAAVGSKAELLEGAAAEAGAERAM